MQDLKLEHLASLALLSMSGLAFEIALTRLLSIIYYPPFVYIVLSIAVLGIGLGAAIASLRESWREVSRIPMYIGLAGISALVVVIFAIMTASFSLAPLLIILIILPFTCTGLALTSIFSHAPKNSRVLYAADLIGAGLGSILLIPLMNTFGILNSLLLIVTLFGIAAMLYDDGNTGLMITLVGLIVYGSNLFGGWLVLDMANLATEKPVQQALANGNGYIVETRYDSFARTDLVQPGGGQPLRIYVDGAAASVMPPASENEYLFSDIGLFAFATAAPERVFAIGSGAGLDVWFAQSVGAREIVAIEVNPESVELVHDFADYNGNIYDDPRVTVHVDEGRSVLQRDATNYDLIYLSQIVTLSAERIGYALTENAIFTVQAFQEYRDHLTPDGYIALKLYDELTLSRSLSIAIEMFKADGLSDTEALQHIIVLLDPSTSPPTPMMMIRNSPFTEDELLSIASAAQSREFATLYLPGIQSSSPLDEVEQGVRTYSEVVADASVDISAPVDSRPFFYQFERGIPAELMPLLYILAAVILVGIIAIVVIQRRYEVVAIVPVLVYFATLGIGFMMVEITVIQQTRLFIGHPTIAITAVLATLLMGGGLGSGLYQLVRPEFSMKSLQFIVGLIVFVLIIWAAGWSLLSNAFYALPLIGRVIVTITSILPLALVMGIPFAAGLQIVSNYSPGHVAFAWTVNGIMTVAGSVLAVIVSILAGYVVVMAVAIVFYAINLLVISRFR